MEELIGKSYKQYENAWLVETNDESDLQRRVNNVEVNRCMHDLSYMAPESKTIGNHIVVLKLFDYENQQRIDFLTKLLKKMFDWLKCVGENEKQMFNKLIPFIYSKTIEMGKKMYTNFLKEKYNEFTFKDEPDYESFEILVKNTTQLQ
mgnify:CR=1 FL=1